MVIQFPKQKRQPFPGSQQANPLGLYLLLVFILLYGASVLWIQHYDSPRSSLHPSPRIAIISTHTQQRK